MSKKKLYYAVVINDYPNGVLEPKHALEVIEEAMENDNTDDLEIQMLPVWYTDEEVEALPEYEG